MTTLIDIIENAILYEYVYVYIIYVSDKKTIKSFSLTEEFRKKYAYNKVVAKIIAIETEEVGEGDDSGDAIKVTVLNNDISSVIYFRSFSEQFEIIT